jgi:TPR repeat protein
MIAEEIYNEAVTLHNKTNTAQSKTHIFKAYLKAAEMGLDLAMLRAGEMLYFGDGIEISKEQGLRWIRKANQISEHYNDMAIQNPYTHKWVQAEEFLNAA